MQFGPCPPEQAVGAILAHAIRAGSLMFKKGRVLSPDDTATLRRAGLQEIVVARLEDGDVREDDAAARIAGPLAGGGVRIGAAFTGRANLYAQADGLALIDAGQVNAINQIDESITLATLQPFTRVTAGQMLATVKIIPYAAPETSVAKAEAILRAREAVSVAAFTPHRAALILTTLPQTKPSLLDKAHGAIAARLTALGSGIAFERRISHDAAEIAKALRDVKEKGCDLLLVLGASAISDRRDVIPAAIAQAGGTIEHFGMPVDPGNLLLIGRLGDAMVIGLPGCARSPKRNGFDFVLWRLLAGLPVGKGEITAMGVGGLLTEIASRPQPREETGSVPHAPKIAAVILAAGLSSRMGAPKLLMEVNGKPLVRYAAEAAVASDARPVIVVTGNRATEVEKALAGLQIEIVENPEFAKGLSESLKRGLSRVPPGCDGALVLLADMPGVRSALIDRLIAAFDPAEGRAICVATRHGRRGNPVLWARRFFPEMMALQGDVGAKSLMGLYDESVCEVEAEDDGPLADIDTPSDLAAWPAP